MKRDERLHGLSNDHHSALVLSRELTRPNRAWTDHDAAEFLARFTGELDPHFCIEDEVLLPALLEVGENKLVEQVQADHAFLRAKAAQAGTGDMVAAQAFGDRLRTHVRFEERELFDVCQRLPDAILDEVARRSPKP